MKPAGFLLLLPVGLVSAAAAERSSGLVSDEIKAKIREGLPAYQAPAPKTEGETAEPPPAPGVLVLPKLVIKERRLPSDAADHLMSKRDFNRRMENLYLDAVEADGPLNYLLNSFTIPILSPSKAARGRALYEREKINRLQRVSEAARSLDPEAARKFQREIDNTHTTRPAGEKPTPP